MRIGRTISILFGLKIFQTKLSLIKYKPYRIHLAKESHKTKLSLAYIKYLI